MPRLSVCFILILFAFTRPLPAQEPERGRFPLSGSHLPENPSATEVVDQANAAKTAGRWDEAVRRYQEGMERFADRVMPLDGEVYVGIGAFCRRVLLSLPAEGRRAYESAFGSRAKALLDRALQRADLSAVEEVGRRFPLSKAARQAEEIRALWSLATGRFEEAAAQLEPGTAGDDVVGIPPAVLDAWRRWGAIRKERGGAPPPPPAGRVAPDSWPCLGGDASRARAMPPLREFPPRVHPIPLQEYSYANGRMNRFQGDEGGLSEQSYLPYLPTIVDGVVYLHNDTTCWAISAFTPQSGALWQVGSQLPTGLLPFEERVLHTTTVANGLVYAPLVISAEEADYRLVYLLVKYPRPYRALFALDAQDGRVRWRIGGDYTGTSFLQRASFPMAPVAEGNLLYVGASYALRPTDPIEHYICCLDALTGRPRWISYVSSGFLEINLFNNPLREPIGSAVAKSGHTVVYCTNMGAIAAVDADTGLPRWIRKYREYTIEPTRDPYNPQRLGLGWVNNPPLIVGDTVYVTPIDSPYLYAIDLATGQERWKVNRNPDSGAWGGAPNATRWVLGVVDGVLILQGDQVDGIDITKQGKLKWSAPAELRKLPCTGRGMLAGDVLWIPTAQGLWKIDPRTGESLGRVEVQEPASLAGLLTHAEDLVCVTTRAVCTLFYSAETADRRVLRDLESRPDDPFLHQRAGLLAHSAGRRAEAIAHFRRVVELTAGEIDGERMALRRNARRALFQRLMEAAEEVAAAGADPSVLEKAFRSALEAAPDTAIEWEGAGRFADLASAAKVREAPLRVLQEFLTAHGSESLQGQAVRSLVRVRIQRLLDEGGREVYAPFEQQARTLFEQGREHPELWRDVYERYPNSAAAEEAMIALARRRYELGRHEEAMGLLQEFLQEYAASSRGADACALLVLAAEARGMWGTASGWCERLQRRWPETRLTVVPGIAEGVSLTGGAFAAARMADPRYAIRRSAPPPEPLSWPLNPLWSVKDPGSPEVRVFLPAGAPPAGMEGVAFVRSEHAVQARSVEDGHLLWEARFDEEVRDAAFASQKLLVLTQLGVSGFDPRTGASMWRCDLGYWMSKWSVYGGTCYALAYPRDQERFGELRLMAVDADSGRVNWEHPIGAQPSGELIVSEAYLVLRAMPDGDVMVFDRDTGAELGRVRVGREAIDSVVPAGPDRFCASDGAGMLRMYGLPSGVEIWSRPVGKIVSGTLTARPSMVAFLQPSLSPGASQHLVWLDADSGRVLSDRETGQADAPVYFLIESRRAVLVHRFRDPNDRVVITVQPLPGEEREVGDGSVTVPLGESDSLFTPALAGNAIVLCAATLDFGKRTWAPFEVVIALDGGSAAQTLRPPMAGRLPSVTVSGGRLFVSQDNVISAFGKR